jgi:trimethylamine:corrinoid methyltransferase-like protein
LRQRTLHSGSLSAQGFVARGSCNPSREVLWSMDNEFARMVKHAVAGVPVDGELLGVDDIAKAGPFGDFLSLDAKLTFTHGRSQPRLIDRRARVDWSAAGGKDLHRRATQSPGRQDRGVNRP